MTVVLLIIIFLALVVFPLIVSRAAEKKDKK
jgi:type II secretory pathway pseudopilin PulG